MHVYLGLFILAFASLALEVTLVRLLSVTTWYHLAFFAISTAMLGMVAGATRVYLRPREFEPDRLAGAVSRSCLHLAWSIPVTLVLLCLLPLDVYASVMSVFALLLTTVACSLPFYFAGTAISAVLTKSELPIGKLYASDLLGASLGCLFVLGGLEILDAPSLILLCSATSALAGLCFAWKEPARRHRRLSLGLFALFVLAGLVNFASARGIRPVVVKGVKIEPAIEYQLERWNSFSRIAVYKRRRRPPQYWGASPLAPQRLMPQHTMNIDGDAGTAVRRFKSRADIEHLRYDVTNVGYYLGRRGKTCVIGVGGGRDLQSAILFGQEHVTGVELNPIFIDLLQSEFRAFAGLAGRPDVTLVKAEARGYLSSTRERYSVIQMSLIDTWAATGAGAFSLSENSLYTLEAWTLFLDRLEENGIFTVSRWHSPKGIGETGRVIALSVAALLEHGVQEPANHLAVITADRISTLLISPQPFSPEGIQTLRDVSKRLRFRILLLPGQPPRQPVFRSILAARSREQLAAAIAGTELNYHPPTDESPYFFNLLRLRNIGRAFSSGNGVLFGNLIATFTLGGLLLSLLVLVIATIVVPLLLRKPSEGAAPTQTLKWGAVYFSLIGAGFMLTEIALIQRLTVLLSHPIYALGILLFTLIASTGVGSYLSDRLPLIRRPWLYVYPVLTAACILGLSFLLRVLLENMVTADLSAKILASVAVIFPTGLLMGMFFPAGMRLVRSVSNAETPWYWALNGIFGVLCSALAVFISIYAGISINFYIAAACYLALLIAQAGLQPARTAVRGASTAPLAEDRAVRQG